MMRIRFLSAAVFPVLLVGQMALAQAPQVTIDSTNGLARVGIAGQVGATYNLESVSSLSATGWDFQITAPLTSSTQSWFDAGSSSAPQRFYRAVKLATPPVERAADFRLIDQMDRSRWLFYYLQDTNVHAVVLIFTGNGCQKITEMIPVIKALTNRFTSQGVLFWLVDSNQQDNRSNILAQATALGISNGPPVLYDAAQLVARAFKAATTPEAVALSTTDLKVFYHGAIDDRISSNAVTTTQYYLSNALVNFLASTTVSPSRARATGCDISSPPRFTNLTYSADIAPLLQDKCVRCHSPGNIAPWAMTNYNLIRSYAQLTKHQVLAGEMPPWHADPFYGSFTNDSSLTPAQAAMLVQWINDGAPSDAGPDPLAVLPPPPTNYPFAWPASLGQPDLVLSIPQQSIGATGVEAYRYINVTTTFPA